MKIKKEHGGASHGPGELGLGTVSQATDEGVFTPTYGEKDKKRKKKDVDALQKFEDYMAEATSKEDFATRLAESIRKSDRNDTGVLNREGEIPGVPVPRDDLEWDKKKNKDHKTTMPMVSNSSTTYHFMEVEKGFGAPSQDDDLSGKGEGEQDEMDTDEEKQKGRTVHLGENMPDYSSMKMEKKLPSVPAHPGVVVGEDIDKKQKQGYTEKDPDNEFIMAFKKMEEKARSYHPTIDEEGKKVDGMELESAKSPPKQNSERAILGQ